MNDARTENSELLSSARAAPGKSERLYAAGGMIGALLASSCCVFPLVFVFAGVSGAWIGNLTALEPYKPIFAAVALLNIGFGFWRVYFRTKADCAASGHCASKSSQMTTQVLLWLGLALVLVALTADWWAPLFY